MSTRGAFFQPLVGAVRLIELRDQRTAAAADLLQAEMLWESDSGRLAGTAFRCP